MLYFVTFCIDISEVNLEQILHGSISMEMRICWPPQEVQKKTHQRAHNCRLLHYEPSSTESFTITPEAEHVSFLTLDPEEGDNFLRISLAVFMPDIRRRLRACLQSHIRVGFFF